MADIPPTENREVVIGGGVHAQVYCATRVALGFPKPLVLEKEREPGGIFARCSTGFWLNSVNDAGIASTRQGPTRMRPLSAADDLNWFPNCARQVRDDTDTEYPASNVVGAVVRANLRRYADVVTSVKVTVTDRYQGEFEVDNRDYGAGRLIDARGLAMPEIAGAAASTPVITADHYLRGLLPTGLGFTRDSEPKRVAVIGDGDTAYVVVESMLGQGPQGRPFNVSEIGWYGPGLPQAKEAFAIAVHARYMGISRHMPQASVTGMIRPYAERGTASNVGEAARVNGQTYDLAVYCTGFKPAFTNGEFQPGSAYVGAGLWRVIDDRYFVIGPAADIAFTDGEYGTGDTFNTGYTRFPRNVGAIFRLAPETARLAASLPDVS